MKLMTMVLCFFTLSPVLFAQKPTDKTKSSTEPTPKPVPRPVLPEFNTYEWESDNYYFEMSSVYSQGELKKNVKPVAAISIGFERHNRHIYAFGITIRPTKLRQDFVGDKGVLPKDTLLSFTTFQGSFGYQYWASKRVALYLFAGGGFHFLTVGGNGKNNNQNNNSSFQKKDEQGISSVSFAPSMGFFIDYRTRQHEPKAQKMEKKYRDSYFRVKFSVNPVWFKQLGDGILVDSGVAFCL